MITYLAMLMTSWAIVCDIDYLSPTRLKVYEDAPIKLLFVVYIAGRGNSYRVC